MDTIKDTGYKKSLEIILDCSYSGMWANCLEEWKDDNLEVLEINCATAPD